MILIEGISLLQINIKGEYMPPVASVSEVLKEFTDKDTIQQFISHSNEIVASLEKQYDPRKYMGKCIDNVEMKRLKYYQQVGLIEYRQIEIIGIEFYPQFVQLNFLYA